MLEKIQASVSGIEDKVLEKIQASTSEIQDVASAVSNFEVRLDVLEGQAVNQLEDTPDSASISETPVIDKANRPGDNQDLLTINMDTLSRLRDEDQSSETSPVVELTNKLANTPQKIGEELIGTCVTPTRVKTVQKILEKENERHLCALKLLPYFFCKEELATSNTDGTYEKKGLDSSKLKLMKVSIFIKFPLSSTEEKERAWRFLKNKINLKCRATCKSLADEFSPARSL